ncbi:glycosyltransferase [Lactobacillus crispatus]|uniref:glycosyltransferase n=1 Tax=Lactobacillus crispatus TaxID=47770 RepID=UPI00336A6B21
MKKILEAFGEPILYGGQEAFVFRTIENMNKKGLKFDFLTPYYADNPDYISFIKSLNSTLYSFNLPFNVGKNRFNVVNAYKKILLDNQYDVVHINSGSISILALFTLYAKKAGVKKVIVHSHMSGKNKNVKHEVIKKIYAPIFSKYADVFVAPTKKAAYWQFSKKIFNKKGRILKNGINIQQYAYNIGTREHYRNKLNISDHEILIGHVGRLSPEKNQIFLIKLLSYFIKNNTKAKLLLIGAGPQEKSIRMSIKQNRLEKYVQLIGNVDNVEDYLQAMDLFIFPSEYEGLGIASIEAQDAGLPVLASTNVPLDIKVTDNVMFLDLNLSLKEWYKQSLKLLSRKYDRAENTNFLKKQGYDIRNTAEKLKKIYLG